MHICGAELCFFLYPTSLITSGSSPSHIHSHTQIYLVILWNDMKVVETRSTWTTVKCSKDMNTYSTAFAIMPGMLNFFWHLYIFLKFITFVILCHCLPQFHLHPLSVVTPSLSLGCFILHVCFGFTTVSTHSLLYHRTTRTTSFITAFPVYCNSGFLFSSSEFQNVVLILTRKTESEERIWVLTRGLKVSGLKYFFVCGPQLHIYECLSF